MELILKDIISNYGSQFRIEPMAGENGFFRPMKWVYVAEDPTTSDFLRGGELIITTGLLSEGRTDWLLLFLERMLRQNTCGLILNLGPYLNREMLTRDVLDFCDQNSYPLFVMPWHIHLYDVTRVFCEQIYIHTRRDEDLREAFSSLLSQGTVQEVLAGRLGEAGYPVHGNYYTAALQSGDDERVLSTVSEALLRHSVRGYVLKQAECSYVIAIPDNAEVWDSVIHDVTERFTDVRVGIGSCARGISEIPGSCHHAKCSLLLGKAQGRPVTSYEGTGLFRLFMDIPDHTILQRFSVGYLNSLHEYDRIHHSELTKTLDLYLRHDGSVKAAAEAAFCHRNTVNHRLQIIREELDLDIDDPSIRLELMCAFLIEEYLCAAAC